MLFHKRLFEESFNSVPTCPRVFAICSHELEDPERIVAKMVRSNYVDDLL
jgi:hypothetical protein